MFEGQNPPIFSEVRQGIPRIPNRTFKGEYPITKRREPRSCSPQSHRTEKRVSRSASRAITLIRRRFSRPRFGTIGRIPASRPLRFIYNPQAESQLKKHMVTWRSLARLDIKFISMQAHEVQEPKTVLWRSKSIYFLEGV